MSARGISTSARRLEKDMQLTKNRYRIKRGDFSEITEEDVDFFRSVLGKEGVLTSDLDVYNTDWLRSVKGETQVVLRPKNTQQISEIVKHCNDRKIAICPQGGNTGLVGGSVPVFDEVVLSTALLNKVEEVDPVAGTVVCGAGCILQSLDQTLEEHGLMVPLDLGAKGSCHIGGNVSTNAGGLRLLRYGSLHGSVLGLECVLASGEILDCLGTLRKDNTGYHLHHLLIGAEGTLGVITRVSIQCPPRPKSVQLALLSLDSFAACIQLCGKAKSELGEILSSCEFIDAESMKCVAENLHLACPIGEAECYMLLETSGSDASHDEEKLTRFLESAMEGGAVTDGTLASEPSKVAQLWEVRERIAEATLADGYCYKYDVSLPLKHFYTLVTLARQHMGGAVTRCVGYGHLGDGNLHLNITAPSYEKSTEERLEPWIYEQTSLLGGSVSAEHGLGFKKRNAAHYTKSAAAIRLMGQVKGVMDPRGIMNPYKVLPDAL